MEEETDQPAFGFLMQIANISLRQDIFCANQPTTRLQRVDNTELNTISASNFY